MHDASSEQAYPATVPCIGDASFSYRLSQDVVSGIGNPRLYANPLYGEPQTQEEKIAQRHVNTDCTQQQSLRFVVTTSHFCIKEDFASKKLCISEIIRYFCSRIYDTRAFYEDEIE